LASTEDQPTTEETPPKAAPPAGEGKGTSGGQTAGQRLAAAKAAKAARKAAERGRDADRIEDQAIARANEAADWLRSNQTKIATALGGALVVGLAIVGWGVYSGRQAETAAALLWDAVETALAPVGPALPDATEERYESAQARTEATLPELRQVITEHAGTTAAVWASLAEGAELLGSGNYAEARRAFEAALASSHGTNATRARALEGIGFACEGEQDLDQALARYEELAQVGGGAYRDLADYHMARVKEARGDSASAIEGLRELVSRLQADDAPAHPYLRGEAEARLAALDPTFGGGGSGMPSLMGGPEGYPAVRTPGGGAMTEEQLQELIRQIQEQQRAAGAE